MVFDNLTTPINFKHISFDKINRRHIDPRNLQFISKCLTCYDNICFIFLQKEAK